MPQRDPTDSSPELRVRNALMAALDRAIAGEPPASRPPAPPPVERPITFNAAMVRALLAGQKTQTRRPIKPQPSGRGDEMVCKLATPGEVLWVREPWRMGAKGREFEADIGPAAAARQSWKPGRFLSRDASRLRLRVTGVRPQRLRDITGHEAKQEGIPPGVLVDLPDADQIAVRWFVGLWDSIYGEGEFAWAANPWVWVISVRLIETPR